MRQVVLDTETTGLEPEAGHRIIEIGGIEIVNRRPTRRTFHRYVNPERAVDPGALEVHGIDNEFLEDKPLFADVASEFLEFVTGAELVIHNADFDIAFLNSEFARLADRLDVRDRCSVLDTLALARRMHPGQRNSLDALAKRYEVDASARELHGALLDARILAEVYLAMTGGQVSLSLEGQSGEAQRATELRIERIDRAGLSLRVRTASAEERRAHAAFLARIADQSGASALWQALEDAPPTAE